MTEKCSQETPCPQATAAADLAVKRMFGIIGVDVDNPEKVEQFREELRFNRQVKKMSDRAIFVAIGTLVATGLAIIAGKLGII